MLMYAAVFAWFLWFRLMKFLNEFSWSHLILSALRKAVGPLIGLFLVGFFFFFFFLQRQLAFAHVGLLTYYISVGVLLAYIPICLYTGEQVGFFLLLAFAHTM
jgi:hypothetical protein